MLYYSDFAILNKIEKDRLDNNNILMIDNLEKCNENNLNFEKDIFIKNLLASKMVCNTGAKDILELMVEQGIDIDCFLKTNNLRSKSFYYDFYQWMSVEECILFFNSAQKELGNLNPRYFSNYGRKISSLQNNLHSFFNLLIKAINFKIIYKTVPRMNRTFNKTISIQYIDSTYHKEKDSKTIKIILLMKFFDNVIEEFDFKHYFWVGGNLLAIPILKGYSKAECNIRYYSYDIFKLLHFDYNYLNMNVIEKDNIIYINNKEYLKKIILYKEKIKNKEIYKVIGENYRIWNQKTEDCITCYQVIENLKEHTTNNYILKKGEIFNAPYNRYEIIIDLKAKIKKVHIQSKKALNIYIQKLQEQVVELENLKIIAQREAEESRKAKEQIHNLNLTLEEKIIDRTLELELAKDQIEKNSEQRTHFYINLAHETKTSLILIINKFDEYMQKLRNEITPELKEMKFYFNKLCKDIANLLDITNIERGSILYNHNKITDISKLLIQVVNLFKPITDKKNITLSLSCENSLYSKIDPSAFERIVINLLDNAIKYIGNGNTIKVILQLNNTDIRFVIADNGMGISKQQQKNIFEPYYQMSRKKSNIQGLGLGLSIVKHIVDSISGNINLVSEINNGTKRIITLLKYTLTENDIISNYELEENIPLIDNSKLAPESYNENKYTVLYVEDHIDLVKTMQKRMSEYFNFYYAINGLEALKKLEDIPTPDIIITDIMMDVMDGHEFYAKLKEHIEYKDIPVIFLTARTIQKEKEESLAKGIIDYIYKPFHIDELIKKILVLLKYRQTLIDKERKDIEAKFISLLYSKKDLKLLKFELKCKKFELSPREKEIAELILKGKLYKEIAYELKIKKSTVSKHIRVIYKKCGVHSNIELVILFMG